MSILALTKDEVIARAIWGLRPMEPNAIHLRKTLGDADIDGLWIPVDIDTLRDKLLLKFDAYYIRVGNGVDYLMHGGDIIGFAISEVIAYKRYTGNVVE